MTVPRQAGFSTLETLVAIAILAICLAPLLTYQAQLAASADRLKRVSELQSARRVATNYLMELSEVDLPEGRLELGGGWVLSWSAASLAGPTRARIGPGLETRYSGELVSLEALLTDSTGISHPLPISRLIITETGPIVAD